ncbi:MAG: BMP family ABC transporter substrate-binding protein, partial [Comamonas sp.]
AKEKGKLAIGNVINTQAQYPDTVVASALWHMEPSVERAIKAVKDGSYKAEDYGPYSMMKHKGSSLAPFGTFEKKLPADLIAKVQAKQADILSGKFSVKVDDTQPKSTAK